MKKVINLPDDGFQRAMKVNQLLEDGFVIKAVDGDVTVVEVWKDTVENNNTANKTQLLYD